MSLINKIILEIVRIKIIINMNRARVGIEFWATIVAPWMNVFLENFEKGRGSEIFATTTPV